jgi:hypothetical protein
MMKYLLFLCLLVSCATGNSIKGEQRKIASLDLASGELHIKKIVESALDVYARNPYSIDIANSKTAIQFTINYHPDDYQSIYGPGGVRKRNLHVLVNEQFLAIQEREAIDNGQDFILSSSKRVFVNFNEE